MGGFVAVEEELPANGQHRPQADRPEVAQVKCGRLDKTQRDAIAKHKQDGKAEQDALALVVNFGFAVPRGHGLNEVNGGQRWVLAVERQVQI